MKLKSWQKIILSVIVILAGGGGPFWQYDIAPLYTASLALYIILTGLDI